ncbi:hypothetical protein [Leucobacter triazinivorans]|uniref:Adhesin domain-containing protein n=1 Tax=Leucobacter triazinivorans TaxID=1784719 RepID=A0A4P6KEW0_9MICO|nr:hypothetical protein [Leucobacter triazinivorans]QBE48917.1 hypothetical protein EVS81_08780 [Leucobacter triazinivorans]
MTTPASNSKSAATTAIVVATAVVGGLALLAVGVSTTVRAVAPAVVPTVAGVGDIDFAPAPSDVAYELQEWDLEGLESLSIDVAATSFALVPGDGEEAVLTVDDRAFAGEWTMYRDEGELVIEHPDPASAARTGGCLFDCGVAGAASVTLALPRDLLESGVLDADISLASGELRGEGSFDELDLEVNVGSLQVTGAARSLDLAVRVGEARAELEGVDEASIEVLTGEADVMLTGSAPMRVDATARIGALGLRLPEEEYRVDLNGALGEVDNRLAENEESPHLVSVQATAAEIALR